jgi:hypothetical protein
VAPPLPAATEAPAEGEATTTTTAPPTTTTRPEDALPPPATSPLEVPARSRVEIRLAELVEAPLASAVVELPGGDVAVEHRIEGPLGTDTAPCATSASPEWHFAWGATTRDAREVLVFFNPFPDDAVLDGTFMTEEGPRETVRFEGFVVPGRSVVGVELGSDITVREQIAASFRARSGRVIIDRIQRFDGSNGRESLTVRLGMPVPAEQWFFPDGLIGDGIREQYVVYNPTERSAEVELDIVPDDPATNGRPEPFALTLLPGAFEVVDVGADGRVPVDVAHTGIVRSLDGVPVVAERVITAVEPADRRGVSVATGSPVAATTWLFPGGGTSDERDEWIYLYNPSNEFLAEVSITGLAGGQELAIEGLQSFELGPAQRRAIRLGERVQRDDLPLIVTSSEAIVAERGLYGGSRGIGNAIGIPSATGVEAPADLFGEAEDDG